MRTTILLLTASAFALVGCFTAAQREAMRIGSLAKDGWEQEKPCLKVIEGSPRYARVYQKLGVSTVDDPLRDPSPAQLADQEVIADEDIAMGLEWYAEFQSCELTALETLGRIDPELEIIYGDRQADTASLLNDVVSKRIQTYGVVNAQIALIKHKQRAAIQSWGRDLAARLSEQHQQELAEREETASELISVVGSIALAVATRGRASMARMAHHQSALAHAQLVHARLIPRYTIVHRVRTIQCQGIGRSLRCVLQ